MFFPEIEIKKEEPEEKIKKITIFDFLKSITINKNDLSSHERFNKDYQPYMINRWLSMTSDFSCISMAMFLTTKNMSKEAHYKFLFYTLPKKYVKFNYVKSKNEYDKDIVKLIELCYNVSEPKACEIIKLLNDSQIKEIEMLFGGEKNGRSKSRSKRV